MWRQPYGVDLTDGPHRSLGVLSTLKQKPSAMEFLRSEQLCWRLRSRFHASAKMAVCFNRCLTRDRLNPSCHPPLFRNCTIAGRACITGSVRTRSMEESCPESRRRREQRCNAPAHECVDRRVAPGYRPWCAGASSRSVASATPMRSRRPWTVHLPGCH